MSSVSISHMQIMDIHYWLIKTNDWAK